jgi:hypothetical protein
MVGIGSINHQEKNHDNHLTQATSGIQAMQAKSYLFSEDAKVKTGL